ncbi:unnamed protein product, partial [Adineta steineri]
ISYNQPKLCANATWNQAAITFADGTTIGTLPLGIFVNTDNSVYVADRANGRIQMWFNGSTTLTGSYSGGLSTPYSVFVTDNSDVYVDNGNTNYRVDKWGWNSTSSVPAMYMCGQCYGLFVDINNMLYCSLSSYHQVIYKSLTQNLNVWTNVAGVSNTAGSTSTTLHNPYGIFIDKYLNLYVADNGNNRIQKFASGQSNGTTISTGAITLSIPTGVILDSDGYIFIVDNGNNRIIGSGPNGFRCIAACFGSYGSSSSQLYYPQSMSFDSYGNIFVIDQYNQRVQKFLFLSNSCNTTTTITTTAATTMMSIIQTTTASTSVSYSNVISFNQPKFGAYATWDSNGITFANSSTVGTSPYGIFIDTSNTVYVANKANNQIQVWLSGSSIPTRNITSGVTSPYSIFATITGDIYVDNGYTNNRVDKWVSNRNISSSVMQVQGACYDLFIDINNNLYCSMYSQSQVAIKSLNGNSSLWIVAAGTGCSGSTSNTLDNPRGIFVDTSLNLYVADCGNNRVQLFLSGQVTATTVAGSTANGTISLSCPSDVALDGDGYIFIVDSNNNRIIGSGPNGFRCIIACTSTSGSASNQLSNPSTFSFDSCGNIYVTDQSNNRVQQFTLQINNCTIPITTTTTTTTNTTSSSSITTTTTSSTTSSIIATSTTTTATTTSTTNSATTTTTTTTITSTTTSSSSTSSSTTTSSSSTSSSTTTTISSSTTSIIQTTVGESTTQTLEDVFISTVKDSTIMSNTAFITTSQRLNINETCNSPTITLIPGQSSLSSPMSYRRSQDFYISSMIQFNCDGSLSTTKKWTVKNCTSTSCSFEIALNEKVMTTFSELYIPSRTLDYGVYQLTLTVTIVDSPNLKSSSSAYVRITATGITANLVQLGTSMITRGNQQDLLLDPG